jgi:hypothetical protein
LGNLAKFTGAEAGAAGPQSLKSHLGPVLLFLTAGHFLENSLKLFKTYEYLKILGCLGFSGHFPY